MHSIAENIVRQFFKDQAGNIAIVSALVAPILLMSIGGVLDITNKAATEAKLQQILDSAVLAGASHDGPQLERLEVAVDFYNGTIGEGEAAVSWEWQEGTTGPILASTARMRMPTHFLGIIGIDELEINVRAAATTARTWADVCWMSMDTDEKHTIEMKDEVKIEAPNCHFYGNSDDFDDVVDLHSCDNVLNALMVQTVGGGHHAGVEPDFCPGPLTDYIPSGTFLNSYVVPDPFGHSIVRNAQRGAGSCTKGRGRNSPDFSNGGRLSPGTYCDGLDLSGNFTLESGVYYVYGDFELDGATIHGNDITFVLGEDAEIDWRDSRVIISAPTSGDTAGFALLGLSNSDRNVFDASLIDIEGVVYMPRAFFTWDNTERNSYRTMAQVQHRWTAWVVQGASWNGDGTVFFNFPEDETDWSGSGLQSYPEQLRSAIPESNRISARLVY